MNPVIENIDNSEVTIRNCKFDDRTVTIPASTTLLKGTVLGILTATALMAASESDAADGSDAPRAILMQDVVNDTVGAVDVKFVRVCLEGEVDASQLVFVNGTDTVGTPITSGVTIKDAMKTEGILAMGGLELSGLDNQ